MALIERVFVDFVKTCGRPGVFNGCEPKMERSDKNDPNSPEVQGSDKNGGGLKWTALVAVRHGRNKNDILSITLVSPTDPCANIHIGQTVVPEDLEMLTMKQDKGGFSQYWSAAALRQVPPAQSAQPGQPARQASAQPQQPARAASGQ
jgi:hypothetical protein